MKSYLPDWRVMLLMKDSCFPYLYLKCGATSPFGNNIPASMRKFLAASLLATEAFLAASNLSCLLLSNKSIFYLLVLKVEHFFCKDYANKRNVSLLTNCRAPLIFCKDYASECNVSLLTNCRVPLIFCKDYASECNVSLLTNCRVPLIFCKDTLFF